MRKLVCIAGCLICVLFGTSAIAKHKPLMRDFMGLCVHTVQFKPELYQPVTSLVRDYHGLNWDVGNDADMWNLPTEK